MLHASNEDTEGSLAEELLDHYAGDPRDGPASGYGVLGKRLRPDNALGVVVISNEYSVSEQLVDCNWKSVWPCSLDQFVETIAPLIEALRRGDVPPWDAFVGGLSPLEPALQLLSALLAIGLLWEAHGDQSKALTELAEKSDKSSPIEFERRLQEYACSLLRGDCKAADGLWAEIADKPEPVVGKLGGGDALKSKLKDLCSITDDANGWKDWNRKLAVLRDELLAKANG